MITPIYFPFTYISEQTYEAIFRCFKQITLYQPSEKTVPESMKVWLEKGCLDVKSPGPEDSEQIDMVWQNYIKWAQEFAGKDIGSLKTKTEEVPFFDQQ